MYKKKSHLVDNEINYETRSNERKKNTRSNQHISKSSRVKNFFHQFFSISLNEVIGDLTDDDTSEPREYERRGEIVYTIVQDPPHDFTLDDAQTLSPSDRIYRRAISSSRQMNQPLTSFLFVLALLSLRPPLSSLPPPFPLPPPSPIHVQSKLQRRSECTRGTRIQLAWLPLPNSTLVTGPGSDQPPGQINPERFKDNARPSNSPPEPGPRVMD